MNSTPSGRGTSLNAGISTRAFVHGKPQGNGLSRFGRLGCELDGRRARKGRLQHREHDNGDTQLRHDGGDDRGGFRWDASFIVSSRYHTSMHYAYVKDRMQE